MSTIRSATVVGLRLGTPITASFLPAFAGWLAILSYRVVSLRVNSSTFVGDKSKVVANHQHAQDNPDPLTIAARAHGNFVEYVPLGLTLAALAELNGGDTRVIAGALGSLLALRIGHSEFGLRGRSALGPGRIIGFLGTLTYLLGMSGYNAWLCKAYWGY